MTRAIVGQSCKGLHNALTSAIARRLPLGIGPTLEDHAGQDVPSPTYNPRPRRVAMTVTPVGRRLLRLEVRNEQSPIESKPPWIRTKMRMGPEYQAVSELVAAEGLHTVC